MNKREIRKTIKSCYEFLWNEVRIDIKDVSGFENRCKKSDKKRVEIHKLICEEAALKNVLISINLIPNEIFKCEHPDFMVEAETQNIGVEIVDLTLANSDKREMYSAINKAIYCCQEEIAKHGIMGKTIRIEFKPIVYNNQKKNLSKIIKKELINKILNPDSNSEYFGMVEFDDEIFTKGNDCIYPNEMSNLKVKNRNPLRNTILSYASGLKFERISFSDIYFTISKKEKKLVDYKTHPQNHDIDKYWLIINIPKEFVSKLDEVMDLNVDSMYDNVFMVDMFNKQVLKLK